jgi:phosphosulfolactate synthase (CoM biosynthesis protein A)
MEIVCHVGPLSIKRVVQGGDVPREELEGYLKYCRQVAFANLTASDGGLPLPANACTDLRRIYDNIVN